MSDGRDRTASHYGSEDLLERILAGAEAAGLDPHALTVSDLGPVDEFHVGGRAATVAVADDLGLRGGHAVLDLGSGIGGTARLLAARYGCAVTGIDLTPEYVQAARALSARACPDGALDFHVGDATDLPFGDDSFDRAIQLHVGMNIADKARLFTEVARVLRPGGRFAVYDIMGAADVELDFPLPWAGEPSISFVDPVVSYRTALEAAGFTVALEVDRTDEALASFAAQRAAAAERGGPAPLGLQLLMGPTIGAKVANLVAALRGGRLRPIELVADLPA